MSNNEKIQDSKQTLEDVLSGEEPTEEFLEEFHLLNESEEISHNELTQQALATKLVEPNLTTRATEPDYKTNEISFLNIAVIIAIAIALLYQFFK